MISDRGVAIQEDPRTAVGDRAAERDGAAGATLNVDDTTGVAADGRTDGQRHVAAADDHFGARRIREARIGHVDRTTAGGRDIGQRQRTRAAADVDAVDQAREGRRQTRRRDRRRRA